MNLDKTNCLERPSITLCTIIIAIFFVFFHFLYFSTYTPLCYGGAQTIDLTHPILLHGSNNAPTGKVVTNDMAHEQPCITSLYLCVGDTATVVCLVPYKYVYDANGYPELDKMGHLKHIDDRTVTPLLDSATSDDDAICSLEIDKRTGLLDMTGVTVGKTKVTINGHIDNLQSVSIRNTQMIIYVHVKECEGEKKCMDCHPMNEWCHWMRESHEGGLKPME